MATFTVSGIGTGGPFLQAPEEVQVILDYIKPLPASLPCVLGHWGQSNGEGSPLDVTISAPPLNNTEYWDLNTQTFQPVVPGPAPGYRKFPNPVPYFDAEFERRYPGRRLILIETVKGGTNFGEPNALGRWAFESNDLQDTFLQAIKQAFSELLKAGSFALLGVIQNQGEGDATSLANAYAYADQLLAMQSRVEQILGAGVSHFPVIINQGFIRTGTGVVRDVLRSIATKGIEVDDLPLSPTDNTHYLEPQYEEIGKRYLKAVRQLPPKVFAQPSYKDWDFAATTGLPHPEWRQNTTTSEVILGMRVNTITPDPGWGASTTAATVTSERFKFDYGREAEIDFYGTGNATAVGLIGDTITNLYLGTGKGIIYHPYSGSGATTLVNRLFVGSSVVYTANPDYASNAKMRMRFYRYGDEVKVTWLRDYEDGNGYVETDSFVIDSFPELMNNNARLFFDARLANLLVTRVKY